ncbi:MAG: DUF503 domain-containing protein [Acidimicrobiia bacterium]|nr:DUF503 domain-containing protein [Acidimicrobiia bacterium]
MALRVDLLVPGAHSLKAKRSVLKALKHELNATYGAAVAEVDHQDLWQRAALGVSLVAPQAGHLDRRVHTVRRHLDDRPDIEVLDVGISYLEKPDV